MKYLILFNGIGLGGLAGYSLTTALGPVGLVFCVPVGVLIGLGTGYLTSLMD